MSYTDLFNYHEMRKNPKDTEWHYVINQVAYVEECLAKGKMLYDDDPLETIRMLARYYRNYKGLPLHVAENKVIKFMQLVEDDQQKFYVMIEHACSTRRYPDCEGYKPLRDFDGIYITQAELDSIKELTDKKEQQVLFACLCFTKMYNETKRRHGRKQNNLFYASETIIRRSIGWKKNTQQEVVDVMSSLYAKGKLSTINNVRNPYGFYKSNQPLYTNQCLIVDNDSEKILYLDNFDTLNLVLEKLLGNKKIKQCSCGRYFEANSNRQQKCVACGGNPPKKKTNKKWQTIS